MENASATDPALLASEESSFCPLFYRLSSGFPSRVREPRIFKKYHPGRKKNHAEGGEKEDFGEAMHTLESNPFDQVVFPKVGRPLIQTITTDEFEKLLLACAPPNETSPFAERAAVRNRAILWLLYDTGIRVSELIHLRLGDVDRKKGVVTVLGKGSKERRIALGQNCLRNLSYYLDKHRPNAEELADWGSAGEDHVFLSETRQPLTKNGMEMLFKRLKGRAGITGKRISPHILRHTFAINYLIKSNDPFSLQELLGHEDLTTVQNYMHMNDTILQEQKRKYSPGDHLPTRMPGPRETRRKGYATKEQSRSNRRVNELDASAQKPGKGVPPSRRK